MGWRVTLIAPGDNAYGTQYIQGVEVWCLPRLQAYFMKHLTFNVQVLLLLVRRWKTIDYILCHQMSFPWLLPLRMLRLLGGGKRPLLLMDTRDLYLPGPSLKNRVRVAFEHSIHTLANQWADGQTAITQRMAELVGIPERQIWGIWPSGVKRERFVPAQRARRWPQEAEPIRLIYIGILLHQRKLLELCQAVEQANAHGMMFQVFLLGNGSARADLEQFAATTEGRIRVVPAVPYDQIPAWLSQAHIGITSLFPPEQTISQASSPIKLFEYMAAGLPILSTEIVCHTDVVGNENYAFWAKDADVESLLEALQTIWQSRQALEQMGHTAAQAADEWTWQAAARKLRAALEYGATQ
jgi:glycosyltransferase involved in cell wall biosynthesis